MSLLQITDIIADWLIIVALAATIVFVVSYAAFFNWRLTPAGRALMYFVLSLVSIALLSFLGRWLGPEYFGRELLRPATWAGVAFTAIRLTFVLWASWRAKEPLDIQSRDGLNRRAPK